MFLANPNIFVGISQMEEPFYSSSYGSEDVWCDKEHQSMVQQHVPCAVPGDFAKGKYMNLHLVEGGKFLMENYF